MRWFALCCLLFVGCQAAHSEESAPSAVEGQSKMPAKFINQRVEQLEVGEVGYVYPEAVRVDLNHYVWLDAEHPVQDDSSSIFYKIQVTRTERGWGLVIPHKFTHTWTPTTSGEQFVKWEYEPVMSIVVEGE